MQWEIINICFLGAMIGAVETLPMKSLSREAYLQKGKLPDWCCIDSVNSTDERLQRS